jgi:hypothetical protein
MRQRNFNMQDTIAILEKRSGIKAVWNDRADTWNYDVRGHDLDGNELTIRDSAHRRRLRNHFGDRLLGTG